MANATRTIEQSPTINLPVSLEQFAHALRKLSRADLLTLEILLDQKAMRTIEKSLDDAKRGKIKEFRG